MKPTAAMAGSLSGAYLGVKAIPKRWLAGVKEEPIQVHPSSRESNIEGALTLEMVHPH